MRHVELLAPVGSYEAMIAAVQSGADAIYLGGKSFGARQNASNFDKEELIKAVDYCHIRGVKIYLTVNTLIANDEFDEFKEFINFLYNIDVDAVIVQDLGALKYIRETYPEFEIHSSTQMTIHNLEGIELLKELGVKRAVLAREMSLSHIKNITENTDMEIEVFVHGALCISYSGQCLMSSLIGGRSGNRGRCAQPCRLPYKLIDFQTKEEIPNEEGDYILSPRDLNTVENLGSILDMGVASLKIEGRMKRPEYVAVVVAAYRKAIDMYREKGKIIIDNETKKELTQIFNRKFTKGYLFGETGKNLIGFERPGNRGVKIGKVVGYNKKNNKLEIELINEIQKGDGIRIKNKEKEIGFKVNEIFKHNKTIENGMKGDIVEVYYKGIPLNEGDIYKTSDEALLRKAKESYQNEKNNIAINGGAKVKLGEEIELHLWDEDGHYVSAKGEKKVEKAIKVSLTKERIDKQIRKVGDTPYYFKGLEIDIDNDISIPISEINEVRRNAIRSLDNLRKNFHKRKEVKREERIELDNTSNLKIKNKPIELSVYVNNLIQLRAALQGDIDIVYYTNLSNINEAYDITRGKNIKLVPALSRISYDEQLNYINKNIDKLIQKDVALVSNHGQLKLLKNRNINLIANFSFNVFNSFALNQVAQLGVKTITLSSELTFDQIEGIALNTDAETEIIAYGHLPAMITEHCVISSIIDKGNKKHCLSCRDRKYALRDRYGIEFPIINDGNCRIEILNSKKVFLLENMSDIIGSGVKSIRLQFTNEDENEIINIVNAYRKVMNLCLNGNTELPKEITNLINEYKERDEFTKGHFFRGVQ